MATKTKEEAPPMGMDSMIEGGSSTAVATVDPDNAPVLVGRVYTDSPEFEPGDIQMPRLRLAQGLTEEVTQGLAKPGQWVLSGVDPEDAVDFIPLMYAKAREYRSADDNKIVLCASTDGKTGTGNPGGNCVTCPFAQWGPPKTPGGKGTPAPCTAIQSYVGWSVQHQQLVAVEFKSTGRRAASLINAFWKTRGQGNFAVRLESQNQQGPKGPYKVPVVTFASVDKEEFQKARAGAASPVADEGEE